MDQQIVLGDGRQLGYAEYGDPNGRPLFFFHGWPGSRLDAGTMELTAARLNVRVIAPDRPGFGLSDIQPVRRMVDWPADVIALADHLGLDRFAVLTLSGGAPYAAVCALMIPERLSAAGIVSGSAPAGVSGAFDSMGRLNRLQTRLGRRIPWLAGLVAQAAVWSMRRDPDRFFDRLSAGLPEADRAILARPEVREHMVNAASEAFRSGSRGPAWDNALVTRPWGFRLEDIIMDVHLWHGELDSNVPPAMGRYLAAAIPHCHATFYAYEGHVSLITNHLETILRTLTPANP